MKGQDLIDILENHLGEKYVFGALAPKDDAKYKGPWDCAEFISFGIYQAYGIAYGWENNKGNPHTADAYTGYFDRGAHHLGKIITIDEAKKTPGALLLRVAANGVTGHIVASKGNGKTIEANSSAYPVLEMNVDNRRWDYGIEIPGVDYTQNVAVTPHVQPVGIVYRYTHPMMVSPVIGRIQQRLTESGFATKGVDNLFGINTYNAVRSFQQSNRLVVDGEVYTQTANALEISLIK